MEEDISKALDAVAWGHRIVDLEETTYVFRPLTLEERNIANYIYEHEHDLAFHLLHRYTSHNKSHQQKMMPLGL